MDVCGNANYSFYRNTKSTELDEGFMADILQSLDREIKDMLPTMIRNTTARDFYDNDVDWEGWDVRLTNPVCSQSKASKDVLYGCLGSLSLPFTG